MDLGNPLFWTALAKLAVFAIFISAVIEVIKAVALKGMFSLLKELFMSLYQNHPLSTDSIKIMTFIVALVYCKVFNYGVMSNVLQLNFGENKFAYLLDFVGTASLVFMGAGWFFDQFNAIRLKLKSQLEENQK